MQALAMNQLRSTLIRLPHAGVMGPESEGGIADVENFFAINRLQPIFHVFDRIAV